MEQELNQEPNINQDNNNIKYNSSCKETLILNKSVIKEALKYSLLMLTLGYGVCDIIDIKTNKKEPSKEANIEFWIASSFTILSSAILIYKIYSDIKSMIANTAIRNSKSPFERILQDYTEGKVEFSRSGAKSGARSEDRSQSLELSASTSEFDYSEL
jgi:hypothetical protein